MCIYDLYMRDGSNPERTPLKTHVVERKKLGQHLCALTLKMPGGWAYELLRPGSFVFLRPSGGSEYTNAPMAVFSADVTRHEMTIVFKARGPKTVALMTAGRDVLVQGPYRGGLLGVRRLYEARNARVLILCSSTGQSLVPNIVRTLDAAGSELELVLDPGLDEVIYTLEHLSVLKHGITVSRLDDALEAGGRTILENLLADSDADLVITLGSDLLHQRAASIERGRRPWVASNNRAMVCGQGTCGSCTIFLRDGKELRGCKVDVSPEDVFKQYIDAREGG